MWIYIYINIHSLQSIAFSIGCCVKFSKIFKMGYVVTIRPQPNWILMDASDTPFTNFLTFKSNLRPMLTAQEMERKI